MELIGKLVFPFIAAISQLDMHPGSRGTVGIDAPRIHFRAIKVRLFFCRMLFMKKIVIAVMAALGVGGAAAQQFYAGASVGMTQFDVDCSNASPCDKDGNGYKVSAGMRLHQMYGAEFGYLDFGKASMVADIPAFGSTRHQFNSSGFYAAVVGRLPLGTGTYAVARAGLISVKTKRDLDYADPTFDDSDTTQRKIRPLLGVGLEMEVTKTFLATLDADFTQSADIAGKKSMLRAVSLGVQLGF